MVANPIWTLKNAIACFYTSTNLSFLKTVIKSMFVVQVNTKTRRQNIFSENSNTSIAINWLFSSIHNITFLFPYLLFQKWIFLIMYLLKKITIWRVTNAWSCDIFLICYLQHTLIYRRNHRATTIKLNKYFWW